MTPKPPITADQIPIQWIEDVRAAVQRDGQPLRAHATLPMIEAKSLRTNQWMPLMLHGSGTLFASTEERDRVLKEIVG